MSAPIRQAALILRELAGSDPTRAAALLGSMSTADLDDVSRCWQTYARPKQLRPKNGKPIWVNSSGRGTGKTRAGSEDCLDTCEDWGPKMQGAIISKSVGDVRDVMIEGVSGLQACARRRGYDVEYIANKSLVKHPSGAVLHVMSAESPAFGVGPNLNWFWADELGAWPKNALARFKAFLFAWRIAAPTPDKKPIGLITLTPRQNEITRWLLKSKEMERKITVTREPTIANRANIEVNDLLDIFAGTSIGRQELEGLLLDDDGALISLDTIHRHRSREVPESVTRRVVSLDPSITANEDSDAAGIIVVSADEFEAFVEADYTIGQATFAKWARQAVMAFVVHDCESIVAEINQGGGGILEAIEIAAKEVGDEMGRELVVPVRPVWAKASKKARAEPVGALYERGRVHHVGVFTDLETEYTTWVPGAKSPNRMDAAVHGITHLLLGEKTNASFRSLYAD